ncbi:hypothetical protein CR513_60001, partial [Mucuna pruriens]
MVTRLKLWKMNFISSPETINKLDKNDKVVRNKARLVAQGFNQQEGIDFTETYALVDRLKAIRILLAFTAYKYIKLFQMDVKFPF